MDLNSGQDADRDGISNIDEIKLGTNPLDINDYPHNDSNNNEKEHLQGDFNGDGVSDILVHRKTDGNLYTLIVEADGVSATIRKIASRLSSDVWHF